MTTQPSDPGRLARWRRRLREPFPIPPWWDWAAPLAGVATLAIIGYAIVVGPGGPDRDAATRGGEDTPAYLPVTELRDNTGVGGDGPSDDDPIDPDVDGPGADTDGGLGDGADAGVGDEGTVTLPLRGDGEVDIPAAAASAVSAGAVATVTGDWEGVPTVDTPPTDSGAHDDADAVEIVVDSSSSSSVSARVRVETSGGATTTVQVLTVRDDERWVVVP